MKSSIVLKRSMFMGESPVRCAQFLTVHRSQVAECFLRQLILIFPSSLFP